MPNQEQEVDMIETVIVVTFFLVCLTVGYLLGLSRKYDAHVSAIKEFEEFCDTTVADFVEKQLEAENTSPFTKPTDWDERISCPKCGFTFTLDDGKYMIELDDWRVWIHAKFCPICGLGTPIVLPVSEETPDA